MKEALRMIKEDLGPDAVILSTRKVMKSNNFGLFARPVLEVTAAVEYDGIALSRQKQSAQGGGYGYESYPSAYTSKTAKKQSVKRPVYAETQQHAAKPVKKQSAPSISYGPYINQKYQNTYDMNDDYLAEAMAEAGIIDDEPFYAPPVRKRQQIEDDEIPAAYMPRHEEEYIEPAPKKHTKYHKYEENDKQDVKKQQEQAKTQAELNAERMAAVIKAVGLDKFTDLLEDIGDIKKQLANMQSNIADNIVIDLPAKLKDYHALFIKNGVDDIISYRLLSSLAVVLGDLHHLTVIMMCVLFMYVHNTIIWNCNPNKTLLIGHLMKHLISMAGIYPKLCSIFTNPTQLYLNGQPLQLYTTPHQNGKKSIGYPKDIFLANPQCIIIMALRGKIITNI